MRSVEEGVAHSRECWQRGFNCAESVLIGACHVQGVELTIQARRMATPFGGGVGRSEDICGALSGGILAIGVALGRSEPAEDNLRSYDAARELHDWFERQFDSTECATLNKGDFKSPEHRTRCGRYVEEAARKTALILKGSSD